ncbi:MAG: heme ABC transporter ATP-binding protein [Stenotrophomonas sp.]|uniref:heme ABC transporter ATP-binding protein n=1 Tax=Stenotrophomonas sp. TaxID=69392 RepID=UPI003D6DA687
MSTPLLALRNASVRRGNRHVLADVSLHLQAGSLIALVGPNGAGKSTLLAVLAGDIAPDHGDALLHGRALAEWPVRELALQRAVMAQDHAVHFAFSVREVVAMGRLPHPADPAEDTRIVDEALTEVDVSALAARDVQTLSGGEAARTSLARALVQRTPVLLLDEPTAALDLRHQERTLHSAREFARQGRCVVVVLHDLNLASAYADRIVMLCEGRIAADGTPREVLTRETIAQVYAQPVQVIEHPTRGVPLVVPCDE